MHLSNFRISSAIVGLTIMSSVTVLFFEPFTYAQGAKIVADNQRNCASGSGVSGQPLLINPACRGGSHESYDVKVTTTTEFEDKHIAKDREDALKKAKDRQGGAAILHYMKDTDLVSLPDALKRKFKDELSKEDFKTPTPDVQPNNYWTGLKANVWEYDKAKDKITERKVELCLGLINFKVNKDTHTVEIGVHHIEDVR